MASVTQFTAEELEALEDASVFPRLSSVPLAGLGMLLSGMTFGHTSPWISAALVAFTASMMFCWTSALHEAAHQTLFKSRLASIWAGRLLGTMMFTPYTAYREVHIRHHAYLNTPRDWELWPYSDPRASLGFRRAFVWFDLLLGVVAGPFIYGRMYWHPESPIKSTDLRRTIRNEYIGIAVIWAAIWAYTTWAGIWPLHLVGVLLPMYLAAFMQTFRKFTEHLGMASFDPLLGTRTVLPRKWILRLSSFLNFDIFIHGPHHRHPRLAHNQLESKLHEYEDANPTTEYPAYTRYWRAMLDMFPSMIVNPGCGINAGARIDENAAAEAEDFASDVVTAQSA